jgi:hypothetical protein
MSNVYHFTACTVWKGYPQICCNVFSVDVLMTVLMTVDDCVVCWCVDDLCDVFVVLVTCVMCLMNVLVTVLY